MPPFCFGRTPYAEFGIGAAIHCRLDQGMILDILLDITQTLGSGP